MSRDELDSWPYKDDAPNPLDYLAQREYEVDSAREDKDITFDDIRRNSTKRIIERIMDLLDNLMVHSEHINSEEIIGIIDENLGELFTHCQERISEILKGLEEDEKIYGVNFDYRSRAKDEILYEFDLKFGL